MEGDENSLLQKDVNRERAFSNTDSRSASSTKASAARKASFDIRSLTSADDHTSIIKNLDDVKPFEEEAETTILRAIEKQDKEREKLKEEDRYTQGILQGVPAEAVHLFGDVIDEDEHNESNQRTISGAPSKRDVIRPMSPTTKPPALKDIVHRMQMMKMMSQKANFMKTEPTENPREELKDPESLQMIGESEEEEEFDVDGNNIQGSQRKTNHVKTFYRKFCSPCFYLTNFISVKWKGIKFSLVMLLYSLVPLLAIAAILFYWGDNPMGPMGGSWSWWLIFVARLSVCFVLAQLTQFVIIDFICLETQIAVRFIGRLLTLMAVQAKGWPVITIFWSMWQMILLHGPPAYNRHWLYRQDLFKIFNEDNPAATIITNIWYLRVLIAMIILGVAVMFKRVYISLSLGKKKYVAYGPQMESIMRKVLLLSEVAMLAEELEYSSYNEQKSKPKHSKTKKTPMKKSGVGGWLLENVGKTTYAKDDDSDGGLIDERDPNDIYQLDENNESVEVESVSEKDDGDIMDKFIRTTKKIAHFAIPVAKSDKEKIFSLSERTEIEKILGEWEEPERYKKESWKDTSIQKVLEFRETLNYMDGGNPLSVPFGPASTRNECLKSSQKLYRKLLLQNPRDRVLNFDTLLVLAIDKKGKLNKSKARALIRLFRPDRKGNLTLLDFVRSCDNLYKRVKLFRATTANAAQLDDAFENLLNIVFYVLMVVVLLLIMQVDFLTVFSTLAGLVLPLSFLFSAAASLYFQGVLLVLVRQPYDIGDRIAVSNPMLDSSPDGSTTWFVENITLFTTTVRNAATNEVATYSNSSLAPLRIINAARSPKGITALRLKFAIDVSLDKIKLFGAAVEEFVKERPREFIKLAAFRVALIEADLGFVQYVLILQHQDSWQNIGAIKQSQADVASFCLELSKKLDMRYVAPPMPVNLSLASSQYEHGTVDAPIPNDALGSDTATNETRAYTSQDNVKRVIDFFGEPPGPFSGDKKTV